MKKILTLVAVAAVAGSAMADLTGFQWKGGKLFDNSAAQVGGAGVIINNTTIDLSAFVVDNGGQLEIDIADIPASFYQPTAVGFAPAFLGGTYSTAAINGTATIEGQVLPTVYGVFDLNGGSVVEGDFIGLTAGFATIDLDPGGAPPLLPQDFNAGDINANIEVVPEPATLGLMGIAGLGMFLARRKARR